MERDVEWVLRSTILAGISTHTLTWSVTIRQKILATALMISTHTLTWSVTVRIVATLQLLRISTHTLTWSVTTKNLLFSNAVEYFNSHAHVERDFATPVQYQSASAFQLTRSRGA